MKTVTTTGCALNDQGMIQMMETTYAKMHGDDKPVTRIKTEWIPVYFPPTKKGGRDAAEYSSKCNSAARFL